MIEFNVQISDPFHTNGFMNAIHHLIESLKASRLNPNVRLKYIRKKIALHMEIATMKSHIKTSQSCANLMKE